MVKRLRNSIGPWDKKLRKRLRVRWAWKEQPP